MAQPFKKFYPVWDAQKLLDWAFNKAGKKATGITNKIPMLMKIQRKEINRVKRATKLMNLHLNICKENQTPWVNKKLKVLIDKKGFENTWLGRTNNYKLVAVHSNQKLLGKFVNVKIKKVLPHYLIAEIIK